MEALDIRYRTFLEGQTRSGLGSFVYGSEMPRIQLVQAADTDHLSRYL